jgi:hypothetical protein
MQLCKLIDCQGKKMFVAVASAGDEKCTTQLNQKHFFSLDEKNQVKSLF